MMVPCNFAANIAQMSSPAGWDGKPTYRHFAAVEFGQLSEEEARNRFAELEARFERPEFKLTLSRIECSGTEIAGDTYQG